MTAHSDDRSFTFTGRHMLIVLVSFFGVVIAVNITMAVLATTSWNGLVAKNGYVASIDYAADVAAKKKAAALGWTVSVGADGDLLSVAAFDNANEALPLSTVSAVALRDIKRDQPQHLTFHMVAPGRWRADGPLPAGRWSVTTTLSEGPTSLDWRKVVTVDAAE